MLKGNEINEIVGDNSNFDMGVKDTDSDLCI